MANELEKLLVRIEADTSLLRRAMKTAEGDLNSFGSKVDSALSKSDRKFKGFASSVQSTMRGAFAALTAGFTLQGLAQAIDQAGQLKVLAETAGMTTTKLQELQVAAEGNKVPADQMSEAMLKWATTMGELHSRTGRFYGFLQSAAPALLQQLMATHSQSEALNVLADYTARLSTAEDRATLVKAALGDQMVRLVPLLEGGRRGLANAADEAHRLGKIVSEEAVAETARLDKAINDLGDTSSKFGKQLLGEVAPALTWFINKLREGQEYGKKIDASVNEWGETLGNKLPKFLDGTTAKLIAQSNRLKDTTEGWKAYVTQANGLRLDQKMPPWQTELNFKGVDALANLKRDVLQETGDTLQAITAASDMELERFRRMLADKEIDEEDFNNLRVALTQRTTQQIATQMKKEADAAREAWAPFEQAISGSVTNAINQLFEDGKLSARSFFADLTEQIAKTALQVYALKPLMDAIFGGGGIINTIGKSFGVTNLPTMGTGKAGGGSVSPGMLYPVNERGVEMFAPDTTGRIIPADQARGAGGGVVYNIDARGSDISVAERVENAIARARRSQTDPVRRVGDYTRRFPTRGLA